MYLNSLRNIYLRKLSPYYFISFPKSGRTWAKSFLANYYSCCYDLPLFYDFAPVWRPAAQTGVPRIVFEHARHRDEGDVAVRRFMARIHGKEVVCWVRDPRRVVFSYYFQLVKRMDDPRVKSMDLGQFIRDNSVGLPRIIKFMNEWYVSRHCFNTFALFRYEDCVIDPQEQFSRLLEFLQAPINASAMSKALTRSVDTTRKIEEGGLVRGQDLVDAVARGTPYFETTDGSRGTVKRYTGDDAAFAAGFTADDLVYMDAEVEKLDPVFGYR